ncbi:uncharacterized protein LOC130679349 [Manis pentadactyla]|uniref:uncharacterized protein LOC130679349 n=1 Tax=Manis pentadactyla TaxID=143292 RepID=UPI00255C7008|nr:uncharacterized protein LOC130679349 [Manis pentadactyla]
MEDVQQSVQYEKPALMIDLDQRLIRDRVPPPPEERQAKDQRLALARSPPPRFSPSIHSYRSSPTCCPPGPYSFPPPLSCSSCPSHSHRSPTSSDPSGQRRAEHWPSQRDKEPPGPLTRGHCGTSPLSPRPPPKDGQQLLQYWPFSSSDLYNWKAQNTPFSENPRGLINLIESLLFTHQPTWDDCNQLLQVLFTTEEKDLILLEAQNNVPGANGQPTQNPAIIEEGFPLTRPDWDFNTLEGSQAQMNTAQSKTCEKLTSSQNERRLPERDGETSGRIRNSRVLGISQESTNLQTTDAEATWFTDGSSYLDQGKRKAGAAVVDGEKIVWAQPLPEETSAQKAELIALTRALELGSGKKISIYTDSSSQQKTNRSLSLCKFLLVIQMKNQYCPQLMCPQGHQHPAPRPRTLCHCRYPRHLHTQWTDSPLDEQPDCALNQLQAPFRCCPLQWKDCNYSLGQKQFSSTPAKPVNLAPQSQHQFAFKWTELDTGQQMQLTWMQLPQGFKNSSTLFGKALAADLASFPREATLCALLQYADDLLLASDTQENCAEGTKALLQLLSGSGY